MAAWAFALWMLPWIGIALAVLYAGYVAYESRVAREQAALAPTPPDHVGELRHVNAQLTALATESRESLDRARDAMQRGLRG